MQIVAIIWGIVASVLMIFMPVWESREGISTACKNIALGNKTSHDLTAEEELEASKRAGTEAGVKSPEGSTKPAAAPMV